MLTHYAPSSNETPLRSPRTGKRNSYDFETGLSFECGEMGWLGNDCLLKIVIKYLVAAIVARQKVKGKQAMPDLFLLTVLDLLYLLPLLLCLLLFLLKRRREGKGLGRRRLCRYCQTTSLNPPPGSKITTNKTVVATDNIRRLFCFAIIC